MRISSRRPRDRPLRRFAPRAPARRAVLSRQRHALMGGRRAAGVPAPLVPANKNMSSGLTYLEVRPSMEMGVGAKMDINTGVVTPPPFVEGADVGNVDGGSAFVEGLA